MEGLKSSWNTIRMKSTSASVREKLVLQMASKMEGQVLQVTLRHDASRIVESILQYGTEKQREKILTELTSKLVEISKTPYGHFVVLKVIFYHVKLFSIVSHYLILHKNGVWYNMNIYVSLFYYLILYYIKISYKVILHCIVFYDIIVYEGNFISCNVIFHRVVL